MECFHEHSTHKTICITNDYIEKVECRDVLEKFLTKNKFQIYLHKAESANNYSYLCICIAKKEACDIDLTTLSPIPLLF